jgi:hypothetical protein
MEIRDVLFNAFMSSNAVFWDNTINATLLTFGARGDSIIPKAFQLAPSAVDAGRLFCCFSTVHPELVGRGINNAET